MHATNINILKGSGGIVRCTLAGALHSAGESRLPRRCRCALRTRVTSAFVAESRSCRPVSTPMASHRCCIVALTPTLNSATAELVAASTRCSPTKPVFGHFRHTLACRLSLAFCVTPRRHRRSRSSCERRAYTCLTCSATSADRGVPTWSRCGPGSSSSA